MSQQIRPIFNLLSLLLIGLVMLGCEQTEVEILDKDQTPATSPEVESEIGPIVDGPKVDESPLLYLSFNDCQANSIRDRGRFKHLVGVHRNLVHRQCGSEEDTIMWDGGYYTPTGRRYGYNPDNSNEYCMRDDHADNGRKSGHVYTGKGHGKTKSEINRMKVKLQATLAKTEGFHNYGLLLDGKSHLSVPQREELKSAKIVTLSTWFKTKKGGGMIFNKGKSTKGERKGFSLYLKHGHLQIDCFDNKGQVHSVNSSDFYSPKYHDGEWHHVVAICDAQKDKRAKLFIDGIAIGQSSKKLSSLGVNNFDLTLGHQAQQAGRFKGTLDDVRVFNHDLEIDEIEKIAFRSPNPKTCQ